MPPLSARQGSCGELVSPIMTTSSNHKAVQELPLQPGQFQLPSYHLHRAALAKTLLEGVLPRLSNDPGK